MGSRVDDNSLLMTYGAYLEETAFPRLELLTSMRSVDGDSSCTVNRGYNFNSRLILDRNRYI